MATLRGFWALAAAADAECGEPPNSILSCIALAVSGYIREHPELSINEVIEALDGFRRRRPAVDDRYHFASEVTGRAIMGLNLVS